MIVVGEWTGAETRMLRRALRMTLEQFAEYLGAGVRTVADWEAAGSSITPSSVMQQALDTALERATPEARARFGILVPNLRAGTARAHGEEDSADRREFGGLVVTSLAAALGGSDVTERIATPIGRTDRVDTSLVAAAEHIADALTGLHRSSQPAVLIGPVAKHADAVLELLDRPMSETDRQRLAVAAVESHTQAAMLAFAGGNRTIARRYFAVARSVADESDDHRLIAQTLGASSVLYSPIPQGGQGGDSRRAVTLLSGAVDHARSSDAPTRGWVHRWLALELAATGDEGGFRTHIEQAERAQPGPAPQRPGYFARSGGFEQGEDTERAASIGLGLALLGHADEAAETLSASLIPGCPRRTVIVLADTAIARMLQGEPKEACDSLSHALDIALEVGYPKGVERIVGVRARMPASWADLPCVRDLDERLRLVIRITG